MAKDVIKDLERKHLSRVIQAGPNCGHVHPYLREAEGDETQGEIGVMQSQPRNASKHQMQRGQEQNLWRGVEPCDTMTPGFWPLQL